MAEARTFPSDTPAPWAEIVPGRGPTSVDDLLKLPDDGWRYEVVEGVLVRLAGSDAARPARPAGVRQDRECDQIRARSLSGRRAHGRPRWRR